MHLRAATAVGLECALRHETSVLLTVKGASRLRDEVKSINEPSGVEQTFYTLHRALR
jgi:hypothetical protein